MLTRVKLAACVLPAVLVWNIGCKSKPSNPEQASQPPAQTAPATSNSASPSSTPSASTQPAAAPANSAAQPAGNAAPNVATNAPAPAPSTPAPAPPPPPPPPPPPIIVPAGTVLHVRLVQAVGSKISQEGQRFEATLSSSVVVKGNKVIPAGSRTLGTVTEAHASGRFKGGATLGLDLNSIVVNGSVYPIRTSMVTSESKGKGKRTTAMIGGGTAGGLLIGGLAGGGKGALIGGLIGAGAGTAGAATGNRDITLASESPLSFQLRSSLTLPPRTPSAAPPASGTNPPAGP
jgi:hypothetical protein